VIAAGPLWIVASVVAVAGLWKIADPTPAARAMQALRGRRLARPVIAADRVAIRLLGLAEISGAACVVIFGGSAAFALALVYGAFALVALRLRGRNVDCGCFGAASTRASLIHVAVDLGSAGVAAWAGLVDVPGLRAAIGDLPAGGIAHLVLVTAGAAATIALITLLPAVRELSREPRGADQPVTFRLRSELA
jgi:hypothetical protein